MALTFKQRARAWLESNADERRWPLLERYVDAIEEHNRHMNLTGFAGDRLWSEGIYASLVNLFAAFGHPQNRSLLDIGAGAGFPSFPYAIAFPDVQLTVIEPQAKRMHFLNEVATQIDFVFEAVIARAEETVNRSFDLITARAVAPLAILLEISSHLGRIGSRFAFLKGPNITAELASASSVIKQLGISEYQIIPLDGQDLLHDNFLFVYTKTQNTPPGFPRPWKKIVKS